MAHDQDRPPGGGASGTETRARSNVGVWAGLGCLGLIVLSCILLAYWARTFGPSWILGQGEEARRYGSGLAMGLALQAIRLSCDDGVPGTDVETWFDPKMPQDSRSVLCGVDEATIEKIAASDQVVVQTLVEANDTSVADRAGMDPANCYRYTTESLQVTGCYDPTIESGIPYKIVGAQQLPAR